MRRLVLSALIAATAATGFAGAGPAAAVCKPFVGPVCLPQCPPPDLDRPLPYACPL